MDGTTESSIKESTNVEKALSSIQNSVLVLQAKLSLSVCLGHQTVCYLHAVCMTLSWNWLFLRMTTLLSLDQVLQDKFQIGSLILFFYMRKTVLLVRHPRRHRGRSWRTRIEIRSCCMQRARHTSVACTIMNFSRLAKFQPQQLMQEI